MHCMYSQNITGVFRKVVRLVDGGYLYVMYRLPAYDEQEVFLPIMAKRSEW